MSWQILVGLSIIFFSCNSLLHRVLMRVQNSDPYAQAVAFSGGVGILALIINSLKGNFHYQITWEQAPYFLLATIFVTIGNVTAFKAFKLLEASENAILTSTQKLWTVVGAFLFLGELFTIKKFIGTIIVLAGVIVAQWRQKKFVINQGVIFALITAVCYSIMEITTYHIVQNFDAITFIVYMSFFPVILLLIVRPQTIKKLNFYLQPKYGLNISLICINDVLATIFLLMAYQTGRNASQIVPLSASTTVISVLLGILILKEKNNFFNKVLGSIIVVTGIIFVLI